MGNSFPGANGPGRGGRGGYNPQPTPGPMGGKPQTGNTPGWSPPVGGPMTPASYAGIGGSGGMATTMPVRPPLMPQTGGLDPRVGTAGGNTGIVPPGAGSSSPTPNMPGYSYSPENGYSYNNITSFGGQAFNPQQQGVMDQFFNNNGNALAPYLNASVQAFGGVPRQDGGTDYRMQWARNWNGTQMDFEGLKKAYDAYIAGGGNPGVITDPQAAQYQALQSYWGQNPASWANAPSWYLQNYLQGSAPTPGNSNTLPVDQSGPVPTRGR